MATAPAENYLTHARGIRSWLCTLDHKRIGVMYLCSVLLMFFVGGIFALIVRTAVLPGAKPIMSPDLYNQMFTLHGTIMIFSSSFPASPPRWGISSCRSCSGPRTSPFPA